MSIRTRSVLFFFCTLLIAAVAVGRAEAQSGTALDSQCASIFGLPAGTLTLPADKLLIGANTCPAYEYLYSHLVATMSCTTGGQYPVTRQQAITGLNPAFAVSLYTLMQKQPSLMITSAYRKNSCANDAGVVAASSRAGTDPHQRGCAVDLSYNEANSANDPCTSTAGLCNWVKTNSRLVGLQLAYLGQPGEANHLQPINLAACAQGNTSPLVPTTLTPTQSAAITNGATCITTALGQQVCGQQNNPYSPFGQNGLLGGNNSMTSMMTMMMGMQLLQGLSGSLTSALAQNTAGQTTTPTPLPPIPLPPIAIPSQPISTNPTTPLGSSSTLDNLLAALNNPSGTSTACALDAQVCTDGSTVGRVAPSCNFAACPVGTSTIGEVVSSSSPPTTATSTGTSTTLALGSISISTSSLNNLQSAFDSLESASATLAQDSMLQSTSTLQTVLNDLYNVLAAIGAFFAQLFGTTSTATS
jgi:hypothetical protein